MILLKKFAKKIIKPNDKPNFFYRFVFFPTSHNLKRKMINKNVLTGDRVLDIGCRKLTYTHDLNCKELIGIDLLSKSDKALGWTSEFLNRFNKKNISLYVASAENLPFPSSSIDKVILIEVIEHIENDEKAISEVSRVLKNSGRLILTTPNGSYVPNTNPHHKKHYTKIELQKLLNQYFETVHIWARFPWISLHVRQIIKNRVLKIFFIMINKTFEFFIGRFIKNRGYTLFALCEGPFGNISDFDFHQQKKIPIICPVCSGYLKKYSKIIKCQTCNKSYYFYNNIPLLLK